MKTDTSTSELLSVAQAAALLGVSAATIRRAADAGVLPSRRSPGGHRRLERAALEGMTREGLLQGGRKAAAGELTTLRALVAMSDVANHWHDLGQLVLEAAGQLLDVTGAMTCDIFKLQDGSRFRCLVSLDREGPDESVVGDALHIETFMTVQKALAGGRIILVHDRDDPLLTPRDHEVYEQYGFVSEACLPLIVQGRVVGVIELYGDTPDAFSDHVEYLESVQQLLGGALEKALLLDAVEDREHVLRELFDLAGLLSQTYDVNALMRTVSQRLVATVHAVRCDIYRRDDAGYRCVVSAAEGGFLYSYEGTVLDLGGSPTTAAALAERRPLVVADLDESPLTERERDKLAEQGLCSELLIPLAVKDNVVGFIDLFDARPRDWRECIEFAGGVGQLVAGALENADLLARLEDRNSDLRSLVEGGLEFGSTLDFQRVLLSAARRMRDAAGAAACEVYTVHGELLRAVVALKDDGATDASLVGRESSIDAHPLASETLRSGRPVTVTDVMEDARANSLERGEWTAAGVRSGLMLPLANGAQMVGLVMLYDRAPRDFGQLDLLRGLSQVAAQAIANARLYGELDAAARRSVMLNEIGAELSEPLDARSLLDTVVRRLRAVADVPACTAYLLVDDDTLECAAYATAPDVEAVVDTGWRVPVSTWPVTSLVIASGRAAAVASLDDPRVHETGRAWLREQGIKSYVVAPLVAKGSVVGTVELTELYERSFSLDEIGLVEAVCRMAGMAIDKATAFEDLERRTRESELLNEIAQRTTASLDLEAIAAAAVAGLSRLAPIQSHSLSLIEHGELVGSPDGEEAPAARRCPAPFEHERLVENVQRQRVVHWTTDGAAADHDARSHAAIGLFERDELVGVLTLSAADDDDLAALDASLLERVGVHLSLAAKNARLYQEIKSLHLSNLKGLSTALNAKDYYTLGHAARVAAYMVLLGEELGWTREAIEQVREAAYLHDIGKIGVSDRVLLKQGPLNTEEWELMRQHPGVSAEIIKPLFPPSLVAAVRHHHERFDGKGYPDGIAGAAIPELARAMCVVDSYDAMSLQRPYKAALTAEQCRAELQRCSGTQFDPDMVEPFLRVLDRLAKLRETAERAAASAAARIDERRHASLRASGDEARPEYAQIQQVLHEVRDAYPEIRYMTTETCFDARCCIVVDAEEEGTEEYSPIGQDVMADDAARQVLSGQPILSNVLFVDNYGVWVNGIAPLVDEHGVTTAVVVADAPALSSTGRKGFARMTTDTPVSTLQEAAVRLSRAEIEAITDGLTGLYNHRYLHERLTDELKRAEADVIPLSLLFCDLDYFKDFNDNLGHAAGDRALQDVARTIERCTRRADVVARYGGEEFVVVLPGAGETGALEIAERIRDGVATHFAQTGGLAISIGVASYPEIATTKIALLEAADGALYEAKRQGRDRVVSARPAQTPSAAPH